MSEERSPTLERMFRSADRELHDEQFVAGVMARAKRQYTRSLSIGLAILLVALPIAWFVSGLLDEPLQSLMQLMARPIAGTGEGSAYLPMNNVGAALVLTLLALRAIARRLFFSR